MTLRRGSAGRLTVYLRADARHHHRPVSEEIIQRALACGLAGASRFHGIQGFGSTRRVHTDLDPDTMAALPCAVEIVDPSPDRLRAFAADLGDVLDRGLVVLEGLEVVITLPLDADRS